MKRQRAVWKEEDERDETSWTWLVEKKIKKTNTLVSLFGFASHFEVKERQMVLHAVILSLSLSRSRDLFLLMEYCTCWFSSYFHSFKKKQSPDGRNLFFGSGVHLACLWNVFVLFLLPAMPFIGFRRGGSWWNWKNIFHKEIVERKQSQSSVQIWLPNTTGKWLEHTSTRLSTGGRQSKGRNQLFLF